MCFVLTMWKSKTEKAQVCVWESWLCPMNYLSLVSIWADDTRQRRRQGSIQEERKKHTWTGGSTWGDKEKQSATRFLGKNQAPAADWLPHRKEKEMSRALWLFFQEEATQRMSYSHWGRSTTAAASARGMMLAGLCACAGAAGWLLSLRAASDHCTWGRCGGRRDGGPAAGAAARARRPPPSRAAPGRLAARRTRLRATPGRQRTARPPQRLRPLPHSSPG